MPEVPAKKTATRNNSLWPIAADIGLQGNIENPDECRNKEASTESENEQTDGVQSKHKVGAKQADGNLESENQGSEAQGALAIAPATRIVTIGKEQPSSENDQGDGEANDPAEVVCASPIGLLHARRLCPRATQGEKNGLAAASSGFNEQATSAAGPNAVPRVARV